MSFTNDYPNNNYTIIDKLPDTISGFRQEINEDQAFWIADFTKVENALNQWNKNLPKVNMCYAIKCNPERKLVKFLIENQKYFDCVSLNEIKLVLELGCEPSKILFCQPLKIEKEILFAKEKGVKKLAVDTEEELLKIHELYENAEIFIKIIPEPIAAKIKLSNKFGALKEEAINLIKKCKELSMNLIGFSFNIGAFCDDAEIFRESIKYVSEFKKKAEELNYKITFINIGDGFSPFSCQTKFTFEDIAKSINESINTYINDEDVVYYAEPKRFIANDYFTLCLPIICVKHKVEAVTLSQQIYIPDSIYGSFSSMSYYNIKPHFIIYQNDKNNEIFDTLIYGETCYSNDIICKKCKWPKLKKGDFMYIENFGAYTYSPTSFNNDFEHHKIFYLNDKS